MSKTKKFPKTLQEAITYFSDEDTCTEFVAQMRWKDGKPVCPKCQSDDSSKVTGRKVWRCRECNKQYSVKLGTIFEQSAIPLSKWLCAMWLIAGAKNGISSYEIHRALGVTQKTAWFMLHRVRLAMSQGVNKMGGEGETIEADETFIGGLSRNMHKDVRERKIKGPGRHNDNSKVVVFGMLERGRKNRKSRVRAFTVPDRRRETLYPIFDENAKKGSTVYTDEYKSYRGLTAEEYEHAYTSHAETYVDGTVHTQGIENFWTLLKRTIKGTYVSIEPFHTFRYLDEQAFRFNEREGDDCSRFLAVVDNIIGRRVTYKQLTGKLAASGAGAIGI